MRRRLKFLIARDRRPSGTGAPHISCTHHMGASSIISGADHKTQRILILGGGFSGTYAALHLQNPMVDPGLYNEKPLALHFPLAISATCGYPCAVAGPGARNVLITGTWPLIEHKRSIASWDEMKSLISPGFSPIPIDSHSAP